MQIVVFTLPKRQTSKSVIFGGLRQKSPTRKNVQKNYVHFSELTKPILLEQNALRSPLTKIYLKIQMATTDITFFFYNVTS